MSKNFPVRGPAFHAHDSCCFEAPHLMDVRHRQLARTAGLAPRIETCWALLGPSRRVLTCGIYRTDVGLEIRVGYGDRMPLYSRNEVEITAARAAAVQLREAVNEGDVFADAFD